MDTTKVHGSVDLDLLSKSRVVGVGVGGAIGLYEDLVRCGLGRLTLVDFDSVDASNLATQGFVQSDVGKTKVEAARAHLLNINPRLQFLGKSANFLQLNEEEVAQLVGDADLLLFMTDSFEAQARGNLTALKFSKPAIFAIMYEAARCIEITFTMPGVTPACHRCAVSPRYEAYEKGYVNTIAQRLTTVFHTHYLNSAIGIIALAILHNATSEFQLSGWFGARWERNLVQIRLHPDYGNWDNSLFRRTFQGCPGVINLDAIWQRIEAESPPKYTACPDCGGGGDLRNIPEIHSTMPRLGTRQTPAQDREET